MKRSILILAGVAVLATTAMANPKLSPMRGTEYSSQYSWKETLPFKVTSAQEQFSGLSAPRRVDLNGDGILDWFLVGALNPKNKNWWWVSCLAL